MNEPTVFSDLTARATRELEVPNASFTDGQNLTASNSTGIGIATNNPNLEQALFNGPYGLDTGSWTLADQTGLARNPQNGSQLGGVGLDGGTPGVGLSPVYIVQNQAIGAPTGVGEAILGTLEEGWGAGEPPPQDDWVMWTGFWRDTGIWIDTATWNDAGG
jgi:hypothetical protein